MSLLMDALRRAQQDKKTVDENGEAPPPEADVGLGLADDEAPTREAPVAGPEDVTKQIEPEAVREAEPAHDEAAAEAPLSAVGADDQTHLELEDLSTGFDLSAAGRDFADGDAGDRSRPFSRAFDDADIPDADGADDDVLALEPLEEDALEAIVAGEETHTNDYSDLTGGTTVGGCCSEKAPVIEREASSGASSGSCERRSESPSRT